MRALPQVTSRWQHQPLVGAQAPSLKRNVLYILGKKKNSSLEVGAPPRVTPAVFTEFHAIGGEEVVLGVEVSWRISGPLIP